ncbi:hypothetical protein PCH_Pc18g01660 [Penicillium rubens Wisconsin 54-1255]|uniref:Uncharacterized protein n=1 Tax=Penicillium rubens (strain ATCC 28089 / DSM 1075 / NRRL 1951 / Wisconsin 54-1255) TaxID=500485 RepID=B6HCG6_PENRW|nr:hypothetical protein PCH_Pc18g01660 [Penicillium rubens Wisconsin 54-1255]
MLISLGHEQLTPATFLFQSSHKRQPHADTRRLAGAQVGAIHHRAELPGHDLQQVLGRPKQVKIHAKFRSDGVCRDRRYHETSTAAWAHSYILQSTEYINLGQSKIKS